MSNLLDDYGLELNRISTQISNYQKITNNKLCVYTCLFGDFDNFSEIPFTLDGFDSFIITDQEHIHSTNTQSILIDWLYRSERRTNRLFKILPHLFFSSYDISLYYDCNLVFKVSPLEIFSLLCPIHDFAIFNHNKRNCLFDEVDECIFWNKDSKYLLKKQRNEYNNIPRHNGLFLGSVLIRNHNNLIKFSEFWWSQYEKFSARDQISLAYALFTINIQFEVLNFTNFNFYFNKFEHLKKNVNESNINFFQKLKYSFLICLIKIKKQF
jgi:hypothetical protein